MHKTIIFILLIGLYACSTDLEAQNNKKMEKQVKKALNGYIDAGDKNDANSLDQYMHEQFRVALYDGKEDALKVLDRKTYRTFIENKTFGGYERARDLKSIQFTGENMASIQVVLTSPGKPTLKNFYSLVKVKDEWLVIQDFVTMVQ